MLDPNLIIPFDGLATDIPDGFARDTRFDGLFVKGAETNLGDTGGAATHSHTSSSHVHAMASHTHTMKVGAGNGSPNDAGFGSNDSADMAHTHWGSNPYTSTAMTGGDLTDNIAYPASNNLPPNYKFIFLISQGYNLIPKDGIVLRRDIERDGFSFHAASAGKNIRGAGTGENAGDGGGSVNHTHNLTHTHSAVNHSHTGQTLTDSSNVVAGSGSPQVVPPHSHILYWQNTALTGDETTLASPAASIVPLSININLFKADDTTICLPGDIVMTLEDEVPVGWLLCDGENDTPDLNGYYIRNNDTVTEGISTTGANTHSHAANNSHSHGSAYHTHTGSTSTAANAVITGVGSGEAMGSHSHSVYDISYATATWASAQIPASSEDNNEPEYIKVKFLQFSFDIGGAALFAMA